MTEPPSPRATIGSRSIGRSRSSIRRSTCGAAPDVASRPRRGPRPARTAPTDTSATRRIDPVVTSAQWKQRGTVRPEPTLAPTRLILEPYGNAANYRSLWLKPSPGGGWTFNQKVGRLLVKGKVNQVDVNQGLSVTLTKANYAGASVCTPGTYLLPPEDGC